VVKHIGAGLAAVALLGGCIFVVDLSGLSGGASGDAGPVDAADASPEGGRDGEADGSPSQPFSCDGASLCDTFEAEALSPPWTRSYASPGASVRIEEVEGAPSPGRALLAFVPDIDGFAYVARDYLPAPRAIASARLSFSVFPEKLDATGRACIGVFVFGEGTATQNLVRIYAGAAGATLEERVGGVSRTEVLSAGPPVGRWSHVSFSLASGRLRAELDGEPVLDVLAAQGWTSSNALRVAVGISFGLEETSEGFTFRFDNVRFEGN
jgi:hypothetical protein